MTQTELKSILHYNPDTGIFTRIKKTNRNIILGSVAGHLHLHGYIKIHIDGKLMSAHRLAWLYMTGNMPKNHIDHINGVRDDNRIENLREVTKKENHKNMKKPITNTSGFIGVYWDKTRNKWHSQIKINQKNIHLGRFDDKQDAITARKHAERIYGFHENHGRVVQF